MKFIRSIRRAHLVIPGRASAVTILGLTLASTSVGCMLSAEADVPDVEVTQHDVAFDGVPLGAALGDVSMSSSFVQKRPIELPAALDSSVQAVKVELRAKKGIENFGFLRFLRITMTPQGTGLTDGSGKPGPKGKPVELVNYERPAGAKVGAILSIPSRNPIDILEQWKTDSASFDVEVAGTLPEKAWSIDISVHFAGRLSYQF